MNVPESTTQAEIAEILGDGSVLSSEECRELEREVGKRLNEIVPRIEAIKRGKHPPEGNGLERNRLLVTGTPEQVAEMDRELERLTIERDQLNAQLYELIQLRTVARHREASESIPRLHDELAAALAKAEEARDALQAALQELQAKFDECSLARNLARHANLPAPVAPEAFLGRIDGLRPWGRVRPLVNSPFDVAVSLGLELSNEERRWAS